MFHYMFRTLEMTLNNILNADNVVKTPGSVFSYKLYCRFRIGRDGHLDHSVGHRHSVVRKIHFKC